MENLLLEERVKKIWETVEEISRKLDALQKDVKEVRDLADPMGA